MLNPQSPIPLYHQLADLLQEDIRQGEYPPGTRIPSEPQLAKRFGIGRPTVRQAIDVLVRKRLLRRRRGSGTYVQSPEKEIDLFSLAGTSSAFQRQGIGVDTELLQPTALRKGIKEKENPFFGGTAYFLTRLNRVNGVPVLLEEIYLHPLLFKGIDRIELAGRSLSQVVDSTFYMRPTGGKQTFRVTPLDPDRARVMEIAPDAPMLVVQRYLNFKQADNAVFSFLYCNTENFVFSQQIGGLSHE
jgi:GntR family transcriptional regulator